MCSCAKYCRQAFQIQNPSSFFLKPIIKRTTFGQYQLSVRKNETCFEHIGGTSRSSRRAQNIMDFPERCCAILIRAERAWVVNMYASRLFIPWLFPAWQLPYWLQGDNYTDFEPTCDIVSSAAGASWGLHYTPTDRCLPLFWRRKLCCMHIGCSCTWVWEHSQCVQCTVLKNTA